MDQALLNSGEHDALLLDACVAAEKHAASVIEGAKRRGDAAGDVMSPQDEARLWPLVMQEAFTRQVVSALKAAARRVRFGIIHNAVHSAYRCSRRTHTGPCCPSRQCIQCRIAPRRAGWLGPSRCRQRARPAACGVRRECGHFAPQWIR